MAGVTDGMADGRRRRGGSRIVKLTSSVLSQIQTIKLHAYLFFWVLGPFGQGVKGLSFLF